MRKTLAAMLASAIIFGASACGVSEGTVTAKNYEEAYTTQEEITEEECEVDYDTKIVNGKSKKVRDDDCEMVGTGEYEDIEHPAVYEFELTNEDGDTGTVTVDADTYEAIDEGEFYSE